MKTHITPRVRRYLQRRMNMTPINKKRRRSSNGSLSNDIPCIRKNVLANALKRRFKELTNGNQDESVIDLANTSVERPRKRFKPTTVKRKTPCRKKPTPSMDESVINLTEDNSIITISDVEETHPASSPNIRKWNEKPKEEKPINLSCMQTRSKTKNDDSVIIIEDSLHAVPSTSDEIAVMWSNCNSNSEEEKVLIIEDEDDNNLENQPSKPESKPKFFEDRQPNLNYVSVLQPRKFKKKKIRDKKNKDRRNPVREVLHSSNENRESTGELREIVVDGCNVATAYSNHKGFDEKGIKIIVEYFQERGHRVRVFVPQHKRAQSRPLLEQYHKEGIVVFTASRKVGGKCISSYDDRYILEYATIRQGIVVSLDQFRDLYREKREWRHTITNRILQPTFVGDIVMFPSDPLGRNGPTLDEFLRH